MPRTIDVYPKDVHLNIEFSLMELVSLKLILDNANIEFNSEENPEMVEAAKILNEHIYPFLDQLCNEQMPDGVEHSIREMREKVSK